MKCKVVLCLCLLLTLSTRSESLKILKKIKDFLHPTTTTTGRPEQQHEDKKSAGDEDSGESSKSDSRSSESHFSSDDYSAASRTTARPPHPSGSGGAPDRPFDVDGDPESHRGGPTSPAGPGYDDRRPATRPSHGQEQDAVRPTASAAHAGGTATTDRQTGQGQGDGFGSTYGGGQSSPGGPQSGGHSAGSRRPHDGGQPPRGSQTSDGDGSPATSGGLQSNGDGDRPSYSDRRPGSGQGDGHDSREALVYPDHPSLNPTAEPGRPPGHGEGVTDGVSTTADPRGGKSQGQGRVPVDDGRRVLDAPPKQCADGKRLDPDGNCRTPARK